MKTVPSSADVTVTATGPIVHLCPHVDEIDYGHITITWRVEGQTFELHALAEYLRGFRKSRISHEEITDRIRHDLSVVDGLALLAVETTWKTAGMEVACGTSPTRADLP